ncbi:hypothetical protein [Thermus filiformis]|uniref:hypothetical protein n=1 Tax=Thermus filiformis TaxID=276 RepID=UPI0005319EE7|nr:hypothetical protein [Thermus filiformis]
MTLHLTRQGATLRLRVGRLLLEEEGREVASFPARKVRQVAVWGNESPTGSFWRSRPSA